MQLIPAVTGSGTPGPETPQHCRRRQTIVVAFDSLLLSLSLWGLLSTTHDDEKKKTLFVVSLVILYYYYYTAISNQFCFHIENFSLPHVICEGIDGYLPYVPMY